MEHSPGRPIISRHLPRRVLLTPPPQVCADLRGFQIEGDEDPAQCPAPLRPPVLAPVVRVAVAQERCGPELALGGEVLSPHLEAVNSYSMARGALQATHPWGWMTWGVTQGLSQKWAPSNKGPFGPEMTSRP